MAADAKPSKPTHAQALWPLQFHCVAAPLTFTAALAHNSKTAAIGIELVFNLKLVLRSSYHLVMQPTAYPTLLKQQWCEVKVVVNACHTSITLQVVHLVNIYPIFGIGNNLYNER